MILINLTSPKYPIWKNGSPSGEYKTIQANVNPNYIVSVTLYEGTGLHQGWFCSKVVVNEGSTSATYYDDRLPNLLTEIINNFKNK